MPFETMAELVKVHLRARLERARDLRKEVRADRGMRRAIQAAMSWLCRAQDFTPTHDGGVAHSYSLRKASWLPSYPETTGYIVPTVLECAGFLQDPGLRTRAKAMLDWLVSIQLPDGGFQGGIVSATPVVPVAFNTGQIVLGLASGLKSFGSASYRAAMIRAADWLVRTQDDDGGWHVFQSPFTASGQKSYDIHIAWGLFEAARLEPTRGYEKAALKNVRWALQYQRRNGWFACCCLDDPEKPLTHTLGYVLRGLIETYRFTADRTVLTQAATTADGLLTALAADGFLPGRLDEDWRASTSWSCLTGTAQVACCWLLLYETTKEAKYRDAAYRANAFLRQTLHYSGHPDMVGGIKGSWPVSGGYLPYSFTSWAAKFFVDANLLEYNVRRREELHHMASLALESEPKPGVLIASASPPVRRRRQLGLSRPSPYRPEDT